MENFTDLRTGLQSVGQETAALFKRACLPLRDLTYVVFDLSNVSLFPGRKEKDAQICGHVFYFTSVYYEIPTKIDNLISLRHLTADLNLLTSLLGDN